MKEAVRSFKIQLLRTNTPFAYQIVNAALSYGVNGINVAIVDIAVGYDQTGQPVVFDFKRGDTVTIEITTNNATYTPLFKGVIDDVGMANVNYGAFSVQLRIFGMLAYLASGTLQSSQLVPKTYMDRAVEISNQFNVVSGKYVIDGATAQTDFWLGLYNCFKDIATDTTAPEDPLTAALKEAFPWTTINADALRILTAIESYSGANPVLKWRRDTIFVDGEGRDASPTESGITPVVDTIVSSFNQMFSSAWAYESFFNRILGLGEMLRFGIIENGLGIGIAPMLPVCLSNNAYPIAADTWSEYKYGFSNFKNCQGVALTLGGSGDGSDGTLLGTYVRPGPKVGRIHVAPAPSFMASVFPVGTQFGPQATARVNVALSRILGDQLAKLMCWEMNYGGTTFTLECPFLRLDVGPGTHIRVDFPAGIPIQEATNGIPSQYGCVQKVTLIINPSQEVARTVYEVGYARSYIQQHQEINSGLVGHPFWSTYYRAGRLDARPVTGASFVQSTTGVF